MPTKISYLDETWNCIAGCEHAGAGCQNCYAEQWSYRLARMGQDDYKGLHDTVWQDGACIGHRWSGKVRCLPHRLDIPRHWKRPRVIGVNFMADTFHETVPDKFLEAMIRIVRECPQHRFLVLSKRSKRMFDFWRYRWLGKSSLVPNLALGVSCSTQDDMRRLVPDLLATPAACRMLSLEPLLGPVWPTSIPLVPGYGPGWANPMQDVHPRLRQHGKNWRGIDGIIIGCESGPRRRPMRHEWARDVIAQAQRYAIPVYLKQAPEHPDGTGKVVTDSAEIARVFYVCPRELPPFFDLPERGETP